MSSSQRLTAPIAAEIDLPPGADTRLWWTRIQKLCSGGFLNLNLVSNGDSDAAIELASLLNRKMVDVALTLARGASVDAEALRQLAPCTVRLPVEAHCEPPVVVREVIRSLAEMHIAVVVVLDSLPPSDLWSAWLKCFAEESITAVNIDDAICSAYFEYDRFLRAIDRFASMCKVPVISDLVLMNRYLPRAVLPPTCCPAGWLALFVSQDGEVRPCRRANLTLGQLDDCSLDELWLGPMADLWNRVPAECAACFYAECAGGCRARARIDERDNLCPGPIRSGAEVSRHLAEAH